MSDGQPRVSVIVTAYNEGEAIVPCLDRIFEAVTLPCEVLVVYDTPEVRARLDAIRAKLAEGKLYLVGASRWLEKAKADAAAGRVPSYWNY